MNKLALVAMALVSLAIVPACTADSPDLESTDEDVAESQSALGVNGSGWASVNASGALNTSYSYNSSGGTITSSKLATGQYGIDFNNIPYVAPSNAQAVAVGSNAQCKLFTTPTGNGLKTSLYVMCYTPAGAFTDSNFIVTLDSRSGNLGGPFRGGFMSTGGGASPTVLQSWNSSGSANTILWNASTSMYEVTFPGVGFYNAAIHVTALGASSNRCKINSWTTAGMVRVQCMTSAGALTSGNGFSLTYQEASLLPFKAGAHSLVSYGAPAPSYSGGLGYMSCNFPAFSAAPAGQNEVVTMTDINYSLSAPQAIFPMVTAHGNTTDYCTISSWAGASHNGSANVACWTGSGALISAANTQFVLTITSRDLQGPC